MEVVPQAKLIFQGVDILNVSYTTKAGRSEKLEIILNIVPSVFYPENQENHFKILMDVSVKGVETFDLTILGMGGFELSGEVSEEDRKSFVNTNAPAIMFPYIRAFISTFTNNLGMNGVPVIIPPHIFRGEIKVLSRESIEANAAQSQPHE